MTSEPAHPRKSRLVVPTGGTDPLLSRAPLIMSSSQKPGQYLQRLLDVHQMDVQSALDQMKSLISTRPQVVYKTSYYRKQTKNHWARDDPAFVALQATFIVVASVAYGVAFKLSAARVVGHVLFNLLWNWLGMGIVIATVCREAANRHLCSQQVSSSHVKQQVEWLYAFDIHCNAFFPLFVVLYVIQFFLLPLVLSEDGFLSLFLANTLYAASLSWYWYVTHLGYRSLPFLTNTEAFLFPIAAILLIYVTMLVGYPFGFAWNAANVMANFYFIL